MLKIHVFVSIATILQRTTQNSNNTNGQGQSGKC